VDAARGNAAGDGLVDLDFLGHDVAGEGAAQLQLAGNDAGAFDIAGLHFAAARIDHGARNAAVDAQAAVLVLHRAAGEVGAQVQVAAMGDDAAEDIGLELHVVAFDAAVFLHLAVLLVMLADQEQVAGGALADAFAVDDFFGDGNLLRCLVDVEEAIARGEQELALGIALDAGAGAGQVFELEIARQLGFQHAAVDVASGQAQPPRHFLQQAGTLGDLRKMVLELAEVDFSAGQDGRRIVAMQGQGLLAHRGIGTRLRIAAARDVHPLALRRFDRGAHGTDIDPAAHAVEPHRGDKLVRVQPGRCLPQLLFVAGEQRLSVLVVLAEDRHFHALLQPHRRKQVFDAGTAIDGFGLLYSSRRSGSKGSMPSAMRTGLPRSEAGSSAP
jgi:hypothetical protein